MLCSINERAGKVLVKVFILTDILLYVSIYYIAFSTVRVKRNVCFVSFVVVIGNNVTFVVYLRRGLIVFMFCCFWVTM